jgi:hypothetical protein
MFMYFLCTTTYGGDALRAELDRKMLLTRESRLFSTVGVNDFGGPDS